MDTSVRRGDIFYADLSPVVGSEQGGVRPVLIIQNDMGNRHSPTVIAAAITSQLNKAKLPTHIELLDPHCGLTKDSVVLLEQIRTLDKRRLRERMGPPSPSASACAPAPERSESAQTSSRSSDACLVRRRCCHGRRAKQTQQFAASVRAGAAYLAVFFLVV